jgi:hypothetical protein
MATKVLDSWALMAFFEDEPAAEQVGELVCSKDFWNSEFLQVVEGRIVVRR